MTDAQRTAAAAASPRHYTRVAIVLHWLVALAVLAMLPLGLVMKRAAVALETKFWLYQLHKSLGFTILALMLVRIVWRLRHAPPPLPAGISARLTRLAQSAHLALYMLLIALPVTGWLLVSSAALNVPTRYFNLVTVPHLPGWSTLPVETRGVFETYYANLHRYTALALGLLVLVHIAAALYHRRHGIDLRARMRLLPGIRPRIGPRSGPRIGRRDHTPPRIRVSAFLMSVALGAALLASAAVPATATAPAWTVDAAASSLSFSVKAGADTVRGRFPDFTARITFDPAAPETVDIDISIGIAALTTGTPDIDAALKMPDWFDAARHPTAHLRATRAERTATGFILHGTLTLRGTSVPVALPFVLAHSGRRAEATGELTLDRLQFGIGSKSPIPGLFIASDVRVTLKLVAERQG